MTAVISVLFFPVRMLDFDDPALDDVRRIALDESVDHAGAAHQTDLPNGQGQKGTLLRAVQLAFAADQTLQAVRLAQLPFQLLFVEAFALEYFYLLGNGRQRIAVLRQLRQAG